VDTKGFGGKTVSKKATIYTNDEKNKKLKVHISGKVEKFAVIQPNSILLKGNSEKNINSSVTIVPKDKYPFKVIGTRAKDGKNIRFKLEDVKKSGKQAYQLTVENLQKKQGRYSDTIYLKTDSDVMQEIEIRVYANISGGKK